MPIPQNADSFNKFCSLMAERESSLKESIIKEEATISSIMQLS
jgi:hypothetical protein